MTLKNGTKPEGFLFVVRKKWKKEVYPLPHLLVSISFLKQISGNSCLAFSPCCRWKVHDDWVSQLKYYDSLRAVISCSNHPETALVIGKFSR